MKSSAETKPRRLKLSAINEHRLSVGLLVLLLLCGVGYLIWLGVASLIPEASPTTTESRSRIAQKHASKGDWMEAISVYKEMLRDDPENGYATARIALTWQNELDDTWKRYSNLSENTGNARAAVDTLAKESELFEQAVTSWAGLLDNARYRMNAYVQLASLHGRRSVVLDSSDELEKAVTIVEEMLDNGITTPGGIRRTSSLNSLQRHPDFRLLANIELKMKEANIELKMKEGKSGRSFLRRPRLGF